jgi:hypothetical protein
MEICKILQNLCDGKHPKKQIATLKRLKMTAEDVLDHICGCYEECYDYAGDETKLEVVEKIQRFLKAIAVLGTGSRLLDAYNMSYADVINKYEKKRDVILAADPKQPIKVLERLAKMVDSEINDAIRFNPACKGHIKELAEKSFDSLVCQADGDYMDAE